MKTESNAGLGLVPNIQPGGQIQINKMGINKNS
jgi:hypothetical protein